MRTLISKTSHKPDSATHPFSYWRSPSGRRQQLTISSAGKQNCSFLLNECRPNKIFKLDFCRFEFMARNDVRKEGCLWRFVFTRWPCSRVPDIECISWFWPTERSSNLHTKAIRQRKCKSAPHIYNGCMGIRSDGFHGHRFSEFAKLIVDELSR